MDTTIESPVVFWLWLTAAGAFLWWYEGRLRDYKELLKAKEVEPEARQRVEELKRTLTIQGFVGGGTLIGLLWILAWVF